MGLTQDEWVCWIKTLSTNHLNDIYSACATLLDFSKISAEHTWIRIGLIGTLTKQEINRRLNEERRSKP